MNFLIFVEKIFFHFLLSILGGGVGAGVIEHYKFEIWKNNSHHLLYHNEISLILIVFCFLIYLYIFSLYVSFYILLLIY